MDTEMPDDKPPFKGGKPSKDDDSEYDVGGPAYPKVPKGVKTSKDAKGIMKAKDLSKKQIAQAKKMKQNDSVAKEQGFKNTEDLVFNGANTDIDDFINQTLQGEDFDKGEELL